VSIADDTIIPAHTVVASFSFMEGRPGRYQGSLPESTQEVFECTPVLLSFFSPRTCIVLVNMGM
jgi:hypothetical protein